MKKYRNINLVFLWVAVASFFPFFSLATFAGGLPFLLQFILSILLVQGGLAAAVLIPLRITDSLDELDFHFPDEKDTMFCLKWLIPLYAGIAAVSALCEFGLRKAGFSAPPQPLIKFALECDWGSFLIVAVSAVVAAPVAEELAYRFAAYRFLNQFMPEKFAIGGASLIFAGLHGVVPQFIPLFLLGIVLQKLYLRGGLARSILMHAFYNAASLTAVLVLRLSGIRL